MTKEYLIENNIPVPEYSKRGRKKSDFTKKLLAMNYGDSMEVSHWDYAKARVTASRKGFGIVGQKTGSYLYRIWKVEPKTDNPLPSPGAVV